MAQDQTKTPVGGLLLASGDIEINAGYPVTTIKVRNTGDRPIQVGSHTHFFEVNPSLEFERRLAYGRRLDIPAGTSLRFEPGESRQVALIRLAGTRTVFGMNGLVNGPLREEPS